MMPQGFAVAMRARGRLGRPGASWLTASEMDCWLLVTRWGPFGEFLSIGHAGGPAPRGTAAPLGLTPQASCLGLLGPAPPGPGPAAFLLQWHPQPGVLLAGRFLRARGVAWLAATRSGLRLSLVARVSGSRGGPWRAGSWRLEAAQASWIGGVLDHG